VICLLHNLVADGAVKNSEVGIVLCVEVKEAWITSKRKSKEVAFVGVVWKPWFLCAWRYRASAPHSLRALPKEV